MLVSGRVIIHYTYGDVIPTSFCCTANRYMKEFQQAKIFVEFNIQQSRNIKRKTPSLRRRQPTLGSTVVHSCLASYWTVRHQSQNVMKGQDVKTVVLK